MLPGVGVFGTGSTARVLVPLLRREGFVVQAVWGRTEEEAQTLSQELGIPFYTSHTDDVLLHPDVDLVCINIPPPLTRQIAVKALGIGKNVICEKAATSADAFKMVTASRYYPQLMSLMGSVLRFLPAFARMKQLLEEGYAGEVQVCDARVYWGSLLSDTYSWNCDELMGGGGLHTMGSYIVDLLSHLTGRRATRVHGLLRTFVRQNGAIRGIRRVTSDDFCFFQMLMGGVSEGGGGAVSGGASGVCCTVTLNFNMPGTFVHEVMVVGSAGRLVARGTELYGQRNGTSQEELLLADPSGQGPAEVWQGAEKWLQDIPMPYLKGMECMVQALRESFLGQEDRRTWDLKPVATAATFEDGLYVQTVVDAIKKSSRTGEWERVEVMTEEPDANHNLCEVLQRNNQ
ncbi:hypothetical protein GJAV_G00064140 [Gymnothorax javanicus]|nr:hypothetical protein GJAV_G00064140 [Gymnothorax javanicus]